jgi:hypothetical protein
MRKMQWKSPWLSRFKISVLLRSPFICHELNERRRIAVSRNTMTHECSTSILDSLTQRESKPDRLSDLIDCEESQHHELHFTRIYHPKLEPCTLQPAFKVSVAFWRAPSVKMPEMAFSCEGGVIGLEFMSRTPHGLAYHEISMKSSEIDPVAWNDRIFRGSRMLSDISDSNCFPIDLSPINASNYMLW